MRVSIFSLVAALLLLLFVGLFSSGEGVAKPATAAVDGQASSTNLAVLPSPPDLGINLPSLPANATGSSSITAAPSAPTRVATSTQRAPAKKVAKPVAITPPPAAPTVAPLPSFPQGDLVAASAAIRAALVNIICYAPAGSALQSISGSGVIIENKGIILTNAHIGQYFLLRDRGVSCVVRTGSPARAAYYAALVFISPRWIANNASVLTEANPSGTGEFDFALLAITDTASDTPLPPSFPSVPLSQSDPITGEPLVIGSYGAQFLATSLVESSLYPTIVYGSAKQLFTFDTNTPDVISLGGSAAAQEGSSGGGALDAAGNLAGTITTSTLEGDTSARTLSAITASYIRRDYAVEMGVSLDALLSLDPTIAITDFAPLVPSLETQIIANLPR